MRKVNTPLELLLSKMPNLLLIFFLKLRDKIKQNCKLEKQSAKLLKLLMLF